MNIAPSTRLCVNCVNTPNTITTAIKNNVGDIPAKTGVTAAETVAIRPPSADSIAFASGVVAQINHTTSQGTLP